MDTRRKGRSRKRKPDTGIKRRLELAALVFVVVFLLAAIFILASRHLSDHVDYPEGTHAWWFFGEDDESASDSSDLPSGSAEIVEGPEQMTEVQTEETIGFEAETEVPAVSYAEPSEELFSTLLEQFRLPEDTTEMPDYGFSMDADDYADTGGTAQGVLAVDDVIPDGCIPLSEVKLPEPVVNTPDMYTYDEMLEDLDALQEQYGSLKLLMDGSIIDPDQDSEKNDISGMDLSDKDGRPMMKMLSAGKSCDEREILVIYVGSLAAPHNVMITGAIHAREYITSDLVMKQLGMLLEAAAQSASFDGRPIGEWLNEVCFTFVPMCNPDGVCISQFGTDGLKDHILRANVHAAYENDRAAGTADASAGFDYFTRRWKSNARGVNLNENFNALWNRIPDVGHMSGGSYKGESPCSEVETKILTILADERHYEAAVHYHAMGELIYWDICNNKLREHARDLSNQIMILTGYTKQISDDGGGYKDYFHLKQDPAASCTVEIGQTAAPVDPSGMPDIWQKNILVPYWTMKWAAEKGK